MTDNTPILFLDVDGVLNSFGQGPWPDTFQARRDPDGPRLIPMEGGAGFIITTSKHIGAALLELPVEIRWLTTWRASANTHISDLVGLPDDLPVAHEPPVPPLRFSEVYNWKRAAVLHSMFEERRPIVWIDDDAIDYAAEMEVNELAEHLDLRYMLVRTKFRVGITPEQINAIAEWAETL